MLQPRDIKTANPRTTIVYHKDHPNCKGKILRVSGKGLTKTYHCHFRGVGFLDCSAYELEAFKDDGGKDPVKGHEVQAAVGNGGAANRLANWLKAKARQESQNVVASNEKALWAEPMKAPPKSTRQKATKIINSKMSEDEKHYQLRMNLTNDKGVSDKKGAKRRISASDAQARVTEIVEQ